MALSPQEQRDYPLAAYNFRVTIDGETMSFAEVSGLKREHQTVTYRHGRSFTEGEEIVKFRIDKYESITLTRGTVKGATFLYDWLESKELSTMEVSLCDEQGTPVIGWTIAKAIPVKLEAPTFDAKTNEVSIESLEVKVAGVEIKALG